MEHGSHVTRLRTVRYGTYMRSSQRNTVVRAFDASGEVGSVIGSLAVSGAVLYGLARAIREANGFDERDKALMAAIRGEAIEYKAEIETSPKINELSAQTMDDANTSLAKEADDDLKERVELVRDWIAKWKERTHVAELMEDASAEEKEVDKHIQHAVSEGVEERVEQVRTWIGNWKENTEKMTEEAMGVIASKEKDVEERVEQVRAWIGEWKENTLAKESKEVKEGANPNMAAAILTEMTEDTPVGIQKEQTPLKELEEEPVLSPVSVQPEAGLTEAVAPQREFSAAPKRRVSIPENYQAKIESLWSNYESMKARNKATLKPQETVRVNPDELTQAETEANNKANPILAFIFKVIAMIQTCFEFVKSLFTGGDSGPKTKMA